MIEQIPDYNLFMMCERLNINVLTNLPVGYYIRLCSKHELDIWKAFPFDDEATAKKYYGYMTDFFYSVYMQKEDIFFQNCIFVCDENDNPVGTCFAWKAYDVITTIHWFKVISSHESKGIGRALLSTVMKTLSETDYPIFLHTQPGSYRAIKLYKDFGFSLITDSKIGDRENDLERCLPILGKYMSTSDFNELKFSEAPELFLKAVQSSTINQF